MARTRARWLSVPVAALILVETGCSTLLQEARVTPPPPQARHCEGSTSVTSTHTAVLPIPLVAFFMPRVTANAPDSGKLLAACGGKQQVNRQVQANYAVCAPVIFVTTLISLGVVGVCPRLVHYEADVVD